MKINSWFQELEHLPEVKVRRFLQPNSADDIRLHTFVDASQQAYAAVSYLVTESEGEIVRCFVASKTKVAPLKAMSIPRLELMGAMLGMRLGLKIAYAIELPVERLTFWSDSQNVLYWIRGQSRKFKPFVANRVGEVQLKTSLRQWRYVPTLLNPADLASRGSNVELLSTSTLWWNGPDYLSNTEDAWPANIKELNVSVTTMEKKGNKMSEEITMFSVGKPAERDNSQWKEMDRLDPTRYSQWNRLLRVYAWIFRFMNNCRTKRAYSGELTPTEIGESESFVIKMSQYSSFTNEYKALEDKKSINSKSPLLRLNPIMDDDGIIRANSRLVNTVMLPYDTRYPIILPRKSHITKLIIKHYHEAGLHVSGVNHILSSMSTRFWLIGAREVIREVQEACCYCKRRNPKIMNQIMAPLPTIRTGLSMQAFTHTAVDFGGPFLTKQGRGRTRLKRYLCLFTCLESRAMHLELAFGLDTESFLNALHRFINRRGTPKDIASDNGTNFVGANNEIRDLVSQLEHKKIQAEAAHERINWHFNPPVAPHFGGAHEILIKAAKRAIHAILTNAEINDEELMTAFTGSEALINSRSLCYQSADPKDDVPLTPNHFLHGRANGQCMPEVVDGAVMDPRKHWRRLQELVRHFWQRWMKEWLPSLSTRKKWITKVNDLRKETSL